MDSVKELMDAFEKASITKMKVEYKDLKLELEKTSGEVITAQPSIKQPVEVVKEPVKEETGIAVHSPLVGIFYDSPSPQSQPFVKAGGHVSKGTTLCIIEAMKVMNEIKAETDGTIKQISVKNGDLVEFDQTLMIIEENV